MDIFFTQTFTNINIFSSHSFSALCFCLLGHIFLPWLEIYLSVSCTKHNILLLEQNLFPKAFRFSHIPSSKWEACLYVNIFQNWLSPGQSPIEARSMKRCWYCWGLHRFFHFSFWTLLWQLPFLYMLSIWKNGRISIVSGLCHIFPFC